MTKNDKKTENVAKSVHDKTPNTSSDETKAGAPQERGGPKGPEPTRFGDWESGGRCTDF